MVNCFIPGSKVYNRNQSEALCRNSSVNVIIIQVKHEGRSNEGTRVFLLANELPKNL